MTTKHYTGNATDTKQTTIMGIPKPSVETIRLIGMMQLALIVSIGVVRDFPIPVLLLCVLGYVMLYPWFGDRGLIEEVL